MTNHRSGTVSALAVLAVLAGASATLSLLVAVPASADTTAVIAMPNCCAADEVALGGNLYALDEQFGGSEQPSLVRIDPGSNAVTGTVALPVGLSTGNALDTESLAVAAGSVWVTDYWHDDVVRVDPDTMAITAQIPVGRSPDSIVYDGRSVWIALNNQQAVLRIDPARNVVVQTLPLGSRDTADVPYQLAFDGTQVLVSMPTSGRVARIDPATSKVRFDAVGSAAAACARVLPAPGGYWLDDTECSASYYRWDARKQKITAHVDPSPNADYGAVVVGNALYTGEAVCGASGCTQGLLVKRDVVTGAQLTEQVVGIQAFLPHFAAGSFWAADFDDGTLQRVADF